MSLPEGLPERTLGWGVLDWCSTYLNHPDGDLQVDGKPWVFSNEQARFLLWFYSVDEYGKFIYRNAVLERPKGWGKSPFVGAISCAELLGPVRFSHFHEDGQPVGKARPSAQVQIAAISEDQTDNTMVLVGEMLRGRAEEVYNLDIGLSRVLAPAGRKLARVTASPRSREGNRPSFIVMDETHLWVPAEHGGELYEVLTRNLVKGAKMGARSIETTNAPVPGEGSVAEASHDAYEEGLRGNKFAQDILFDTRQVVVPNIYEYDQAIPALIEVYGDAADPETGWIDLKAIWSAINDPRLKENDARRFYFNQRVADAAQWIKPDSWNQAKRDIVLGKRDKISLGIKSVTTKGCALVGTRIGDGAQFVLGFWEKPKGLPSNQRWEVPIAEVDDTVRYWLDRSQTCYLVADPQNIQDVVSHWTVDYPDQVEEIWLNQHLRQWKMVEQYEEAIYGGRVVHSGEFQLSRHISNCYLLEKTQGYVLRQDRDYGEEYIFAAQAAVLSYEAAQTVIEKELDGDVDSTIFTY